MTEGSPNVEFKIIASNEEDKLTKKHNIYEKVTLDPSDLIIDRMVRGILAEFKGTPETVEIRARMFIK